LLPLLEGRPWQGRNCAIYGEWGTGAVMTTPHTTYASKVIPDCPLYRYTTYLNDPRKEASTGRFIHGLDALLWREPFRNSLSHPEMLFDRQADPGQDRNLAASDPALAARCRQQLKDELTRLHAPEEQFVRLGLN
jgi:hypothetical protein